MQESEVYKKLQNWAEATDGVRAMIVTSSKANPSMKTDMLSDYDIELFVNDLKPFMNDDWLNEFGTIMIRWPLEPTSTEAGSGITRLVRYEDELRIDFQITTVGQIDLENFPNTYKVLLDKDGLSKKFPKPTFKDYVIQKPTEQEFNIMVNEFFWDATYVPKNLLRDELPYAKYMFDGVIRFNYFERMIEWYIGMQNDWSVSTDKHGRYFKRYLDKKIWSEYESTFAASSVEDNWKAFFNMLNLFSKLAKAIAKELGYEYAQGLDEKVSSYCRSIKQVRL